MYIESLSEYGSGWEWEWNTYAHAFDYTKVDVDVPEKYTNSRGTVAPTVNGTWVNYGTSTSEADGGLCDYEITSGQPLYSNSLLSLQKSCVPHSYNAGNYYNFPAASASTPKPATSSICPKGWSLPQNGRSTGYSNFLIVYGVDYNASKTSPYDAALINLPLSFLRSGTYHGGGFLGGQGSNGNYRTTSLVLGFDSGGLGPTNYDYAEDGYSVRCVSR